MAKTIATPGTVEETAAALPADLSMVVLTVRDMPLLRRFYRALGWQEQPGASDTLSIFPLAGATLALHPDSDTAAGRAAGTTASDPGVTMVVRVTSAGHVNSACSAAVQAGARVVSEPEDQPWGGRSALVADPEDNRWELLWVPRPSG